MNLMLPPSLIVYFWFFAYRYSIEILILCLKTREGHHTRTSEHHHHIYETLQPTYRPHQFSGLERKKKTVFNIIEKPTFNILGLRLRDKTIHRALFARILSLREFLFQCKYFCYEDFRPSLQDALTHCGDATSAIGDSVVYRAAGKFKTEEFLIRRSVIHLVWNWYPFAC